MSDDSREAAEIAAAMVRAYLGAAAGAKTPEAAVESMALELFAARDEKAVAHVAVALVGLAASSTAVLAFNTKRPIEEYLAAFIRGAGKGKGADSGS